jgi:hypothetical protein
MTCFERQFQQGELDVRIDDVDAAVLPRSEEEIKRKCEDELKEYRRISSLKFNDDPLVWWKTFRVKFPTLWLLARYYLSIPATSTLSERCFSAAGRFMSAQRAGVTKPDNFEDGWLINRNIDLFPITPQKITSKRKARRDSIST